MGRPGNERKNSAGRLARQRDPSASRHFGRFLLLRGRRRAPQRRPTGAAVERTSRRRPKGNRRRAGIESDLASVRVERELEIIVAVVVVEQRGGEEKTDVGPSLPRADA